MGRWHVAPVLGVLLCARAVTAGEVPLWPEGPPGFRHTRPETVSDPARDDGRRDRSISYVSIPTLTIHEAPDSKATGATVLVLPGGGYRTVVIDKEGNDIARWLNTLGITAAVLKYRTRDPDKGMSEAVNEAVLADGRRAMRYLRTHAGELTLDPERIGVMGFSAGGDLALRLATAPGALDPGAFDDPARASALPNFVALIYPGVPSGRSFVPRQTSPFFIVHAADDPKAPALLSLRLTQELAASGASVELHAFRQGDHGFALGLEGGSVRLWPTLFEEWLRDLGLLDRKVARVVENKPPARIGRPVQMFWFAGPGAAFAGGVAATLLLWLLIMGIRAVARRRSA